VTQRQLLLFGDISGPRAALDPTQFEFIDIRARAEAARPPGMAPLGATGEPWLADACSPQVSCDIAVYSAEFAGRFFGKSGPSLSLQEMEEASCQARCAGLFRDPTEVFLLACNTLANKNEDSRTPEQYLQVLIDHGFDRASARHEVRASPVSWSHRVIAASRAGALESARALVRLTSDTARAWAAFASFWHTSFALPERSSHFSLATSYCASARTMRASARALAVPLLRASSSASAMR
jgi:hypothetical protein